MPYTEREQNLLERIKLVVPANFLIGSSDDKILAFVDLVVNDINWILPYTNWDRNTFPNNWFQSVILGTAYFSMLFKQMEVTLEDFTYSDSGLSVTITQTEKINTAIANMLKAYIQQVEYMKKKLVLEKCVGLGTPRFQSQIGQFLKIALGSAFTWGSPNPPR